MASRGDVTGGQGRKRRAPVEEKEVNSGDDSDSDNDGEDEKDSDDEEEEGSDADDFEGMPAAAKSKIDLHDFTKDPEEVKQGLKNYD